MQSQPAPTPVPTIPTLQVKKEVTGYVKNYRPTISHLIFLGYFLVTYARVLVFTWSGQSSFSWVFVLSQAGSLATWIIGGVLGWNLLVLDSIFYLYFTDPNGQLAAKSRELYRFNLLSWFKYLFNLDIPKRAIGSALFGAAWILLAGFALTSTVSYFGKGVIMGLGLHLLLQMWMKQSQDPLALNSQLFWQIKRPVSNLEQKWYLWIFTGFFILLTLLV